MFKLDRTAWPPGNVALDRTSQYESSEPSFPSVSGLVPQLQSKTVLLFGPDIIADRAVA